MKAFEIHTFHNGRWKVDSIFDDRELALFEAKRITSGGRHLGVRVVEEDFTGRSKRSVVRTIFHSSRVADAKRQVQQQRQPEDRATMVLSRRPPKRAGASSGRARAKRHEPLNPYRLIGILVLVLGFGVAALMGLRVLQQSL
jgi:hypothetical protein